MRLPALFLALMAPVVAAESPAGRYDPVQFEQRFHKADQGKKGKLSREEAYGEFPRMPEFFDAIDVDRDGFITLDEVNRLVEKRTEAAITASQAGARYGSLDADKPGGGEAPAGTGQEPQFASETERRHYYRNRYFEELADEKARALYRGEVVSPSPTTPLLKKSF